MQILLARTIYRRTTPINGLLDNNRQSTLIREDFTQVLKLKVSKKTISISSVMDVVESERSQSERSHFENLRYEGRK